MEDFVGTKTSQTICQFGFGLGENAGVLQNNVIYTITI